MGCQVNERKVDDELHARTEDLHLIMITYGTIRVL
jgi:hypothetical protein